MISTVAADGMVLKHQAISIHNTESWSIFQDQFHKNYKSWLEFTKDPKSILWKKSVYGLNVSIITDVFKIINI